jgi:peptide/nickel transport system substrate-binding protein
MSRARLAASLALIAALATACGGQTTLTPQPSAPPTQAPANTLVFGSASDPATLDAILIQDGESFRIAQQIYETLVRLKPGSAADLEPGLATSWDVSADGLTYTFHLRPGVTFTDGTPFNADAAVSNVTRWKHLPAPLQASDYYDRTVFGGYDDASLIASVTRIDAASFSIALRRPKADFLTALTLVPFAMQSPAALKGHNADLGPIDPANDYWQTAPTGTGPFTFKEFVPGDHYTIVRNPRYWDRANAAHLDAVEFRPIADTANRLVALQAGTVDIIDFVDAAQLPGITSDVRLQLIRRAPLAVGRLAFNQTHKPFDDPKVRKAVAWLIDKPALVTEFFPGLGSAADSDLISNMAAYEPNVTITGRDPQKAKALLAQSTCPAPCSVDFWYPDGVAGLDLIDPRGEFEAISAMLEADGLFKVIPKHKPWMGGYLTDQGNGIFPMFLAAWTYDYADPADGPGLFYATSTEECNGVVPAAPHNCEFGEDNPAVASAIAKAIAEPVAATRTKDWKAAMRLINADVPDVPLVWAGSALAATKAIGGYVPSPTEAESFNLVTKTTP